MRKRDATTRRALLTAPATEGLSPGRVRTIAKRQFPAAIRAGVLGEPPLAVIEAAGFSSKQPARC